MKLFTTLLILSLATICRASYVTDAVAQMPAQNSADESVLAAKIFAGGEPAIKELTGLLIPLGTEGKDDTKARYAISALVRHAGRAGGEADRATLTKGICAALAGDADTEVKSFYICRLQEIGRDDAVPALAPYLADEKLGLYASAALERIGTPAATEELVKAVPSATGKHRVAIIKSLGALRATGAAAEIRKSASDDDKDIRMTALWALANLGDASCQTLLPKALADTKSAYDQSRIYSYVILHLRRSAENGAKPQAADACVAMLTRADAMPVNMRIAAARLLAELNGDDAIGVLLPLAEKGDAQFRAGALDSIAKIPGDKVTPALVGRLKAVTAADVKVELLLALAKRNDAAARPAVIDATKETDAAVRTAAVTTLVSLGREEAVAPLVDMIVADSGDAKSAAEALSRIAGDKPLAAAAGALASANPKAKVALLELLARGATGQKEAVLKQAADSDESVRLAAFKAMEKLGAENDTGKLIDLAIAAKSESEAAAALKAAAACAAHAADADHRSEAFIAALTNAKGARRTTIEKAVAKIGGAKALEMVVADLKSDDKAVRQGALAALADWSSADALPALLQAAKSDDTEQQVTAIRGAVQVLRASTGMSAADKAAAYKQAMSAAVRPQEKKMILGALGAERGQEIFELAASMLDAEGVKAEASLAVIKTAIPQPKGQAGLKGPKVIEALKVAIPNCPDAGLKADAQRYLKTLEPAKK